MVPAAAAVLVAASTGWLSSWRTDLPDSLPASCDCRCTLNGVAWSALNTQVGMALVSLLKQWCICSAALAPLVWVGIPLGWSRQPKPMLLVGCLLYSWPSCQDRISSAPMVASDPTAHPPRFQGLLATAILMLPLGMQSFALPLAVAVGTMGLTGLYLQLPKPGPNENDGFPGTGGICSLLDACCTSQRGARV